MAVFELEGTFAPAGGGCELDRILDQVLQDQSDKRSVRVEHKTRLDGAGVQCDLPLPGKLGEVVFDPSNKAGRFDLLDAEPLLGSFYDMQVEQVVCHLFQARDVPVQDKQNSPDCVGVVGLRGNQ